MFLRFELTIFQHWFRQWLGTDQATKHYLNQWWLVYWCIYASLGLNELNVVYILQYIRTHEVMCWIPKNYRTASRTATGYLVRIIMAGPILGLLPANERRRYFVTTSLIGWVLTPNQPCNGVIFILISLSLCYFLIFFLESMTLSSGRNKHLAYNISQFNNMEEKQTTLMKSFDSWEQVSVKFELKFYSFAFILVIFYHLHSRKCIWKCCLSKWRPFCPGGDELMIPSTGKITEQDKWLWKNTLKSDISVCILTKVSLNLPNHNLRCGHYSEVTL